MEVKPSFGRWIHPVVLADKEQRGSGSDPRKLPILTCNPLDQVNLDVSRNTQFITNTWEVLDKYRNMTSLPIILKGIQTVADARAAIDHGVPAIILSNHGCRNLDGSPSSLEIALEIYNEDPAIFSQIEILADGGVRHGTDALRLLALGVKAVGLGRPFMYSNVFGLDGVKKAVQIMHTELMNDAANLGVPDIKAIDASYVDWTPNFWYS